MKRIDSRWIAIALGATLLGVVVAALLILPRAWPFVEQKYESLRYRVLELVPPPAHPDFVPTPLPTLATVAEAPEPSPTPTTTAAATAVAFAIPPPTATPQPAVPIRPIQQAVRLTGFTHDYQRWNNCGPTTLEMYLSLLGIHDPQTQIAAALKPDPDDKNVRPDELAGYAIGRGVKALVRVNGSLERIKLFLSNGIGLVVETGFDPPRAHQGWMGHYRLITGYNERAFITQDSYDGPNVEVEFGPLDADWKAFNRTFLILYSSEQAPLVQALLGDDFSNSKMFESAAATANEELAANEKDAFAAFNLGSSLLGLKRYSEAAAAFDKARTLGLPWRMMWYEFGPYEAYFRVGRYQEVISLSSATLKVVDDLEESHYYKGLALEALGKSAEARAEFAAALKYNKNYGEARRELARLSQPQP